MKIKIYNTVQEFLKENEAILLEKEAVTQLILHNCFSNREKEVTKDLLLGRVEDEQENLKLIFANVNPFNLLIHNLDGDTAEAIKVLTDYLIEDKVNINGINANKKICDEFINYYENITGCMFKEHLSMDVMELTEINKEVKLPNGTFRVANLEDKDLLIEWHIKFAKEALDEDMVYDDFKEKLNLRIENQSIYVFEDEFNKPMAMAASTRQLVNGVSVSLVYSSKDARGKGYGLAVVYNLSKEYLARGNKFCSLFVDKKNPVSNGVYRKIGYKILEDNYDYRIVKEV